MPRKGERKERVPIGDASDPQSFAALLGAYAEWLRVRNYSEATVRNREHYVGEFAKWCLERSLSRPCEVTKPLLERYQRWLYQYRQKNGKPLTFPSQLQHLIPVRAFFKWLGRNNHILANPAADLELPRGEKRLPKHILTANEAERVLALPPLGDPLGLRDRALLELLYSTGMRRMEAVGLKLYDLDAERGTVMIRWGKGKKDRMVPMGERAFAWVMRYLEEARPKLALVPDDGTVFLTNLGTPFEPGRLTQLVRDYIDAAETGKRGSCHLFRHTCATLMLEGGADVRFIQQLLGHAELSTTQIYTQVSIRMLKEVHTRTHPGATLSLEAKAEIDAELAEEAAEDGEETSDEVAG
ncbi:MAG: site-specific tyrosine recombinase XerC [Opitutaceae bacterium]